MDNILNDIRLIILYENHMIILLNLKDLANVTQELRTMYNFMRRSKAKEEKGEGRRNAADLEVCARPSASY